MAAAGNQALATALAARLEAVNQTVRTLRDTLTPEQLRWRPPEGAWSVTDVLEHLIRSHDDYLPMLRAKVASAAAAGQPAAPPRPWKKTLVGGWFAGVMRSERKFRSPRSWRAPDAPRADAAEAFLERQHALLGIMLDAAPHDWRAMRVSSPIAKLVRMNIGDAFEVLTSHAERHARQMERLLDRPDFPGRA